MDQSVKEYVSKSRAEGVSDEQIKTSLLSVGWSIEVVNEALQKEVSPQIESVQGEKVEKQKPLLNVKKRLVLILMFISLPPALTINELTSNSNKGSIIFLIFYIFYFLLFCLPILFLKNENLQDSWATRSRAIIVPLIYFLTQISLLIMGGGFPLFFFIYFSIVLLIIYVIWILKLIIKSIQKKIPNSKEGNKRFIIKTVIISALIPIVLSFLTFLTQFRKEDFIPFSFLDATSYIFTRIFLFVLSIFTPYALILILIYFLVGSLIGYIISKTKK